MLAAVIHSAADTPRAEEFADPPNANLRVLAAGLHPLVKGRASGKHYTSSKIYPQIVGVDGVGELAGKHVYFGWIEPPYGTFAERAAAAATIPVPDGVDPALAAAIVNPAMSSWLALNVRANFQKGEHVLILGATGASGKLAVQVARALGAGRVVAAARNPDELAKLGADLTLRTDHPEFVERLREELVAHGCDIVLDYLWGQPAEHAIAAFLAAHDEHGERRTRYVNIGQSAGGDIKFSPHLLRSTRMTMLGSGFGSVTPPEIGREIPKILAEAARGALTMEFDRVPLSTIGDAWSSARRVVVTM